MSQENILRGFCPVCIPKISLKKYIKKPEKLTFFLKRKNIYVPKFTELFFFGTEISTWNPSSGVCQGKNRKHRQLITKAS